MRIGLWAILQLYMFIMLNLMYGWLFYVEIDFDLPFLFEKIQLKSTCIMLWKFETILRFVLPILFELYF